MNTELTRRKFVGATATAALAGSFAAITTVRAAANGGAPLKLLGVSCSPRRGMTTAKAVQIALDAAKGSNPRDEGIPPPLIAKPLKLETAID